MDDKEKIKELEEKNAKLEEELQATKDHLKKYTAPASRKVYYEKNKDKEKQRAKEYQQRTNYKSSYEATPEQKKEYARRAYLKKKERLQKEKEENQNTENI
jgi:hypothetical protein